MTCHKHKSRLARAQQVARGLGFVIRQTGFDSEVVVFRRGLTGIDVEREGYYTDDIDDAIDTVKAMARRTDFLREVRGVSNEF